MEILINNFTQRKTPSIIFWWENFWLFWRKNKREIIPEKVEISVAIVGEKRMTKLNELYRKKLGATDVLSFVYEKNKNKLEGELIFCPWIIKKRAKENKNAFFLEWQRDFIHGMLHLLGMRHSQKMFDCQEKILLFSATKKKKK